MPKWQKLKNSFYRYLVAHFSGWFLGRMSCTRKFLEIYLLLELWCDQNCRHRFFFCFQLGPLSTKITSHDYNCLSSVAEKIKPAHVDSRFCMVEMRTFTVSGDFAQHCLRELRSGSFRLPPKFLQNCKFLILLLHASLHCAVLMLPLTYDIC